MGHPGATSFGDVGLCLGTNLYAYLGSLTSVPCSLSLCHQRMSRPPSPLPLLPFPHRRVQRCSSVRREKSRQDACITLRNAELNALLQSLCDWKPSSVFPVIGVLDIPWNNSWVAET